MHRDLAHRLRGMGWCGNCLDDNISEYQGSIMPIQSAENWVVGCFEFPQARSSLPRSDSLPTSWRYAYVLEWDYRLDSGCPARSQKSADRESLSIARLSVVAIISSSGHIHRNSWWFGGHRAMAFLGHQKKWAEQRKLFGRL